MDYIEMLYFIKDFIMSLIATGAAGAYIGTKVGKKLFKPKEHPIHKAAKKLNTALSVGKDIAIAGAVGAAGYGVLKGAQYVNKKLDDVQNNIDDYGDKYHTNYY